MTPFLLFSLLLALFSFTYGQNMDCALLVPQNPLSAVGLATPYQLLAANAANGPCWMNVTVQQSFVEGVIYDPATGSLSVYNPLVITQGTVPAIVPTVPTLPADAVVAIWFGSNANTLLLIDDQGSLIAGNCVNGDVFQNGQPDIFGQFASCNGRQFFTAFKAGIAKVPLNPPLTPLGTALDGMPCLTVRDFGLVDMDQSDNVVTSYILFPSGRTAQNTAANTRSGTTIIVNGSDNRLLAVGMSAALGCNPYQAPDLANNGAPTSALALDEIQASFQQMPPIALIPKGDEMVRTNNLPNLAKINLYRDAVFQEFAASLADASTRLYCVHFAVVGASRISLDQGFTEFQPTADPALATNLFTFLAQRFFNSWTGLACNVILDIISPVQIVTDGNGVCTGATFNLVTDDQMALVIAETDQALINYNNVSSTSGSTSIFSTVSVLLSFIALLFC
jgi:hypothetical protein